MAFSRELRKYYKSLGLRGVCANLTYRLTGQPREISARTTSMRYPVHLRIGTTDPFAYAAVLLRREYAFDLPFCPMKIIDAGANVGLASIYFAHTYPEAKIVAIEPEAANFAVLSRNVNCYRSIMPVQAALWNQDGQVSIAAPDPATGAYGEWGFVTHEGQGTKVRAVTIPSLLKELGWSSIDILKMDIEGAEKEVFQGCDWMQRVRCLMIELHDRFKPGCSAAVKSAAMGMDHFERGETSFYLRKVQL